MSWTQDQHSAATGQQTTGDPTFRACLLRLKLYVHDFDQSLSPDIISRCRGLLVLAQTPNLHRLPYIIETTLLEALLAIKRLCQLATLSKMELEREYCSDNVRPQACCDAEKARYGFTYHCSRSICRVSHTLSFFSWRHPASNGTLHTLELRG